MKKNVITSVEVKLNGDINGITWVLFDTCMHRTFKYQEREAAKYGFKRMDRANGVRIYGKFYGTREAALADKENIKAGINALRTYNSGKIASGIGNVICDNQFAKGTYENPYLGWTNEGTTTFLELMK